MRVLVVVASLCCLLAGSPRAFAADPTTTPTSTPEPTTTSAPVTSPTTAPAGTTAPATTPPAVTVPDATPPAPSTPTGTAVPTDLVASPSAAEQAAARSAFATLSDAHRGLLRRLQDARDQVAVARVAALAAGADAAFATQRSRAAADAADRAQAEADAIALTLARLHAEIQELAGFVYRHGDPTVALSEVDTAATIELARAREYSMAPSEVLLAQVDAARARQRRLDDARDEAARRSRQATELARIAETALARQRAALATAERTDALAVVAVTEALGSGAALLTQVADPHFGADGISAALATAQLGQGDPATVYGLFRSPVPGAPLGSAYGMRVDPVQGSVSYHPGIDLDAGAGVPIRAAAPGIVVIAGDCGGYGNCVVIDHGHSLATLYGHQSRVAVSIGDVVADGQVIGLVGSTGKSTGPHLHFEVRFHGAPVDPVPVLAA